MEGVVADTPSLTPEVRHGEGGVQNDSPPGMTAAGEKGGRNATSKACLGSGRPHRGLLGENEWWVFREEV